MANPRHAAAKPAPPAKHTPPAKRAAHAPIAWPGALAIAWCAAWLALMLAAPPLSTWVWSVNGFRSEPPFAALTMLVAAVGAALLPLWRRPSRNAVLALWFVVALIVSYPLRERLHFLGDSDLRGRAITAVGEGAV